MAYCVIRTDLMSGTRNPEDLVSVRFYNESNPVEVENGVIAELEGYDKGSRDVMKAKAASSKSDINNCVIIAGVEVMYDERKKNLDEFINEKGKITRGFIPRERNMFSVTKEGFEGNDVPELNGVITIGNNGKLKKASDANGFGKCVHIETTGRYTYYTIEIHKQGSK